MALGMALTWTASMTVGQALTENVAPPIPEWAAIEDMMQAPLTDLEARVKAVQHQAEVASRFFDRRPLRDIEELELTPWWKDWCDHDDPRDSYWRSASARDHLDQLDLPVLNIAGWHDFFVKGTLEAFQAMRRYGVSEATRRGQRLVVGPWHHTGLPPRPDLDPAVEPFFGLEAGSPAMRFYDHHLKDEDPSYADQPPVRLYVMGDNCWRDEWEWPLARTEWTSYYLHSAGGANTVGGDGSLSTTAPGAEAADSFLYDPADPVPGSIALGPSFEDPVDLGQTGMRSDVLVFTTEPLLSNLEITGPVTLELWASSSVQDTDFTAKLIDVFPDGDSVPLCQGVVRTSRTAAHPTTPGAIYRFDLDLWATSNVFKVNHRIRLYVSSSEFPTYELNPNTGERITHDTTGRAVPATQHVFHDPSHPSRLILPVIPR
jgi:putative CocE/NonD family hydrolase